jgi:predicted DNA-binding protein with PD1-like motif
LQAKQLREAGGQKIFVVIFDTSDEAVSGLTEFAIDSGLDAASFTAIGAFGTATLGYC